MHKKIGKALVVGAGISGIRAALDLAETGYGVTLIDRSPHMGGVLSQLDHQFPTDRCGMCKMLPLVDRDASSQYCLRKGLFHENIEILLSTELVSVDGEPGNFQVLLRQKSNWVDPQRCIGCGECAAVCPVEVPDTFNVGFSPRKAIYLPLPHAVPNSYIIDLSACTQCGECEKICPTGAVCLSEQERKRFRILVVDDELIVRDSLKEWLEEEGFSVDMADSGAQALQKLANDTFHLMLTDIKMPGMDGVELLEKAKEDQPGMCVVMMTAYATVETAVEAMKIGAFDYLVKPFEPDKLIPMVVRIYEDLEATRGRRVEAGAVVVCGGTAYYDPSSGINPFGYKVLDGVVTSLEFERIFSGSGPSAGKLVRPGDGRPVRRVAWIHCVGSRDLQAEADFCSSICCMYAIKEARLAREKSHGEVETTLFFMDMRTFGKSFQRYRDQAESVCGVRFERGRVHSVVGDPDNGDLLIRYVDTAGKVSESRQDMVVLAVGQRPAAGSAGLAAALDLPLNSWGFGQTEPFSLTRTARQGIFLGGSFSGLKDIGESVTQASSAALAASRVIHQSGGSLALETPPAAAPRNVLREPPDMLVVLCICGGTLVQNGGGSVLIERLSVDPAVSNVTTIDKTCTSEGWEQLVELVEKHKPNRLLIGACQPYVYARKIRQLAARIGLDASLLDVVDLHLSAVRSPNDPCDPPDGFHPALRRQLAALETGLARLKHVDPVRRSALKVQQRALVVGGGIAGMSAALAIADHGYPVDMVEEQATLGGNLQWLKRTLEGEDVTALFDETRQKIDKHPLIETHCSSRILTSFGKVGHFVTTVETEGEELRTLEHGAVVLATGGKEAPTDAYGYGTSECIVTQKEFEMKWADGSLDAGKLNSVVMIQCVGSREEPRNYCSRVCCPSALKHALALQKENPEISVTILYRDMMTTGFTETYFTEARRRQVLFVQYATDNKPTVKVDGGGARVTVFEPIVGKELEIEADLVVLATGIVPNLPGKLAAAFGATIDPDGFFQEAESKWRPVDSLKEGIFACGLALSPRSVTEAIATAEAAAQRALRILCRDSLPAGKIVATVRRSLCSLCERCIDACPYQARALDANGEKVIVNAAMCQGCGECATVCPNNASVVDGFGQKQMLEIIDAAFH
ncbi:MAG: hypothetical protein AMJ54_00800 [Deltaproteobacteria bacterium SG8_13]|nr:MAG: hypothetical protein AMJ54_00800 [Deltaproteobacteria bacterium SG8_13]